MIEVHVEDSNARIEAYSSACRQFGEYLDGKNRGSITSQKATKRREMVTESSEMYGNDSLLQKFNYEYVCGYVVVVQALNTLRRNKIDRLSQLLNIDIQNSMKHMPGFGSEIAVVVGYMKQIVQAEMDLPKKYL